MTEYELLRDEEKKGSLTEQAAPQLTHIVVKEQPEPEIVTHHIAMREQSNQD